MINPQSNTYIQDAYIHIHAYAHTHPPPTGHSLIQFLRDCVVSFLEDETPAIRKEAALTCAHLLLRTHESAGNVAGVAISVQV